MMKHYVLILHTTPLPHFRLTVHVYIDNQLSRVLSIQILLTSSIHVTKAATITCDHLYCIPVPQSTFLRSTTILRHSTRAAGCTPAPAGWILIRLAFHHHCVAGTSRCLIIIIIALHSSVQLSLAVASRFLLLNSCIKEPHSVFCCI